MSKGKNRFHAELKATIWHARNHPAFREMLEEGRRKRALRRLKMHLDGISYPEATRRIFVTVVTRH